MEDGIPSLYSEGVSLRGNPLREGAIFRGFRPFTEEGPGNHLYLHRLGKRRRIYLSPCCFPMSGNYGGRKTGMD